MTETRKIDTVAEIPMGCECGWSGNEAECSVLPSHKMVRYKISAQCPKCGGVALQTEDCKYRFK